MVQCFQYLLRDKKNQQCNVLIKLYISEYVHNLKYKLSQEWFEALTFDLSVVHWRHTNFIHCDINVHSSPTLIAEFTPGKRQAMKLIEIVFAKHIYRYILCVKLWYNTAILYKKYFRIRIHVCIYTNKKSTIISNFNLILKQQKTCFCGHFR